MPPNQARLGGNTFDCSRREIFPWMGNSDLAGLCRVSELDMGTDLMFDDPSIGREHLQNVSRSPTLHVQILVRAITRVE